MASLKDINLYDVGNSIQMVGAIYADTKQAYVLLFPEDHDAERLPSTHLKLDHEEWKTFIRQTDLVETEILTKDATGGLVKAILRKSSRNIEPQVMWNVYARDNFHCRYCGRKGGEVALTVDHLVLWELGGPNTEANLVASCRKDNKARGNTSYSDWLKSEHYLRVSKGLAPEVRAANEAALGTLDAIPRVKNIKSR